MRLEICHGYRIDRNAQLSQQKPEEDATFRADSPGEPWAGHGCNLALEAPDQQATAVSGVE